MKLSYFLVLYRRRMCLNFTSLVSKRFLAKRNYSFGRTINFILASSYGLFSFFWYIWKIEIHCLFYMEGGGGGVHALQYRVAGSPKKSFWHINFLLLLNKLIYLIFRLFSESEYGFVIYFWLREVSTICIWIFPSFFSRILEVPCDGLVDSIFLFIWITFEKLTYKYVKYFVCAIT